MQNRTYVLWLKYKTIHTANNISNILKRSLWRQHIPYSKKNRGAAHFAAHVLHVGNVVGCPWAAHGNFAMQMRLPTTSIYGKSGQLSGQLSRQPTASNYEKSGQLSGQRSGLPMGILPCKLGCPLLPYTDIVDSSVGNWVGSLLNCPLLN